MTYLIRISHLLDNRLFSLMALIACLLILPADSYGASTYTLSVVSEPADLLHINGDGKYTADEYATTGTAPTTWMGYEFVGWQVDGVMYAGNPASILMDSDHEAVAVYEKQKTTIIIDSYPRISSVVVDDVTYLSSDLPLRFEWDPSSTHSIIFPEKVDSKTFTRYVFAGWNDDLTGKPDRELVIDGRGKTVKAFFGTQYYLKLVSEHGAVSGSGWYNDGDVASISVLSQYQEAPANGSRFAFDGWTESAGTSFDSQNSQVIVDRPIIMTAKWEEQNLLTLHSSIDGIDLFGGGWYKKGSSALIMAPQQFQEKGRDCRFAFDGWTLAGPVLVPLENAGTSNHMTVNMDNPYTVTADWKELCYLKIVDPKTSGQGYYEIGSAATVTLAQQTLSEDDTRLVPHSFTVISDDESSREILISNQGSSMPITIEGPTTIQTNWKKQYRVDVSSGRGIAEGSGWYDEGSVATVGMKQSRDPAGFLNQYKFSHWEGTIHDEKASVSIIVDGPKELRAVWVEDVASEVFNAGIVIVTISIGALFYVKFKSQIKSYTYKLAGENPSGIRQIKRDEL